MQGLVYILPLLLIPVVILIIFIFLKLRAKKDTAQKDTGVSSTDDNLIVDNSLPQSESGVAHADTPSTRTSMKDAILAYLKDPRTYGIIIGSQAFDMVLDRLETSIRKGTRKLTRPALNTAAKSGERSMQRLGVKLASVSGERLAIKAATKSGERAGASLAAKAGTAAATGPGAPFVFAAEMAFSVFTSALDGMNLGGFNDLSSMSVLNEMRDTVDKEFADSAAKEGITLPLVYGPLDQYTEDEFTDLLTAELIDVIKNDASQPTDPPDSYYDQAVDTAIANLCTRFEGFMSNGQCSFKKEQCVSPWPLEAGDTYYEFKNNVCQARPSTMREHCEGMRYGVTYNVDTGSCNLSRDYCGRFAGSAVVSNGDCVINDGQDVAEAIFGTVLTRSIVNIFDFKNNYESCPPGTNEPDEFMWLGAGAGALAARYLCSGSKCKADEEMMMSTKAVGKSVGGLCYEKCPPGYSSQWNKDSRTKVAGMCYKDCPYGSDPTAAFCTSLLEVRVDDNPTVPDCPSGWTDSGVGPLMCRKSCPADKPRYDAGFCRPAGGALTEQARQTCPDQPNAYYRGLDCEICDWHWNDRKVDGSCRHGKTIYAGKIQASQKTCPQGYTWDGVLRCYQNFYAPPSDTKINRGVCPAGKELYGGLCYTNCDSFGPDWKRTAAGACQKGGSQIRDTRVRNPKGPAYTVFPKNRTTHFPSTTEEQFGQSTLGKYIEGVGNAVNNHDAAAFGKSLAGLAIVGNPAVLALGAQDLADIGYQKASS